MLKLISKSSNKKLGPCASTYRAGALSVYGTCPSTCSLKPDREPGAQSWDPDYLNAVLAAVPRDGVAWTYTHFQDAAELARGRPGTCINFSCDSISQAESLVHIEDPTLPLTAIVPDETTWGSSGKVLKTSLIKVVRCPAEYSDKTCFDCGGDTPLCARPDRNYVIGFTAHGSGKKTIRIRQENPEAKGGCYGNSGPVRLQWNATKDTVRASGSDAETLLTWVKTLPSGTKLRHHVLGDLGHG